MESDVYSTACHVLVHIRPAGHRNQRFPRSVCGADRQSTGKTCARPLGNTKGPIRLDGKHAKKNMPAAWKQFVPQLELYNMEFRIPEDRTLEYIQHSSVCLSPSRDVFLSQLCFPNFSLLFFFFYPNQSQYSINMHSNRFIRLVDC